MHSVMADLGYKWRPLLNAANLADAHE